MHYVQELVLEDFDWKIDFCENKFANNLWTYWGRNDFANNIVFFDKTSFKLHRNVSANASDTWTLSTHILKSNK